MAFLSESRAIFVVADEVRRLRCGPQDRRLGSLRNPSQPRKARQLLQVFGRTRAPPVAVAEFDEATSPANNASRCGPPPFGVAAQPIAASQSSSVPTGFWRTRAPVAVAEFDEATSPANNASRCGPQDRRLGGAAQPIAASQSSSAPTGFWRTRALVAVAEFDEATSGCAAVVKRQQGFPLKHIKTQKPAYKHMNFCKCLAALFCAYSS